jgi:hypothetical protein
MFRPLACTAVGLGLLALTGALCGSELSGGPTAPTAVPRTRPVPKPVPLPVPPPTEGTCGNHGTQVHFVDTPREAAKIAKKEQKLVFVLHVSGHFEDPRFT